MDVCDLEWGASRRDDPVRAKVNDRWAVITETSVPAPNRYVRRITTFLRNDDGCWRRDDERHENVLVEASRLPGLLARNGLEATLAPAFGSERLPPGLVAGVRHRPG